MVRLLRRLGWTVTGWNTIVDHQGEPIDLRFASPDYVKRHAARRHHNLLLRACKGAPQQAGWTLDGVPLRNFFRQGSLRERRALIRMMSGTVLTAALTKLDEGRCPLCGCQDTVDHRIRQCWVYRDEGFDLRQPMRA